MPRLSPGFPPSESIDRSARLETDAHASAASSEPRSRSNWHRALRIYVGVTAAANFAWEVLQLPLYTIWSTGTLKHQAFAVIHCTGGDVLIAVAALTIALISVGTSNWPAQGHVRVLVVTLALGLGYTIFSEWFHVVVRSAWAYSRLMPVMPILNIGLSPFLQWILIPAVSLTVARKFRG